MKSLIYTSLLLCLSCMTTASAATRADDYSAEMEALLAQYDKATDAASRKTALDAMNALDKQYRREAVMKMWQEFDKEKAGGAEFRRIGLAMAAAGEKKACRWCFEKGAESGDPYCANRVLIEQLTELNNPEAAMHLFSKMKYFTLPLIYNMGMAMFVLDTPESRQIARVLAESYFELTNDKEKKKFTKNQYDVFDDSEYIFYADSDILKQAGKCWRISSSGNSRNQLKQFYENSNK